MLLIALVASTTMAIDESTSNAQTRHRLMKKTKKMKSPKSSKEPKKMKSPKRLLKKNSEKSSKNNSSKEPKNSSKMPKKTKSGKKGQIGSTSMNEVSGTTALSTCMLITLTGFFVTKLF